MEKEFKKNTKKKIGLCNGMRILEQLGKRYFSFAGGALSKPSEVTKTHVADIWESWNPWPAGSLCSPCQPRERAFQSSRTAPSHVESRRCPWSASDITPMPQKQGQSPESCFTRNFLFSFY